MELDERQKIYENAISKWGENEQIWMAIEEMGELIASINRYRRGRGTPLDLLEEIADVQIMSEQLAVIFGAEEIEKVKIIKLERLKGRIKDTSDVFQEKLNTLNRE